MADLPHTHFSCFTCPKTGRRPVLLLSFERMYSFLTPRRTVRRFPGVLHGTTSLNNPKTRNAFPDEAMPIKTRLIRLISQIPARRWPGLLRLWLSAALVVGSVWSAAPFPVVLAATIIVSGTADSGPGSLRQALLDATDGDVINIVAAGVITPTSGELPITKTLTINGPG